MVKTASGQNGPATIWSKRPRVKTATKNILGLGFGVGLGLRVGLGVGIRVRCWVGVVLGLGVGLELGVVLGLGLGVGIRVRFRGWDRVSGWVRVRSIKTASSQNGHIFRDVAVLTNLDTSRVAVLVKTQF